MKLIAHNCNEEPRRKRNSTPLERSYNSLFNEIAEVTELGVADKALIGNSHWGGIGGDRHNKTKRFKKDYLTDETIVQNKCTLLEYVHALYMDASLDLCITTRVWPRPRRRRQIGAQGLGLWRLEEASIAAWRFAYCDFLKKFFASTASTY